MGQTEANEAVRQTAVFVLDSQRNRFEGLVAYEYYDATDTAYDQLALIGATTPHMWFDNFPFSQTFHFGAVAVNPYGLAYLVSFLVAYTWLLRKESREPLTLSSHDVQRLLFYCLVAVLLGGRCAFLAADAWHDAARVQYYLEHPAMVRSFRRIRRLAIPSNSHRGEH